MYRFLIVDDHEIIRAGLRRMLNRVIGHECEFYEADSGESAIKLAEELACDVVFCDIKMGEMSGLEAIKLIKQALPHAYFIIISGYDCFEYAKQAIQLGVSDYLLKPLNRDEVETVATRLIERLKQCGSKAQPLSVPDVLTTQEENNIRIIEYAIEYIHENYSKDLTLSYMSNLVSKNYSYFSTLFKSKTGMTFSNYLRNVRIEKAKELLKDVNYKVVDVYRLVGFSDYNHFCKTFTKSVGMSPNKYKWSFLK